MVRPLLFALFAVLILSFVLGSRSVGEPLEFTVAESTTTKLTLGGEPLRDLVPLASTAQRQADQSPATIRLSQVSAIRSQGKQAVLMFDDGSQLAITPYIMESLAPELSIRLSYER